ncbi:hypothetical protein [Sorangium sp. So ce426]|uniref:hypothetical protein n=1 Tax=Sorangium sp. So ce426 TaxID=3133312 RepID=UPI003F5AE522
MAQLLTASSVLLCPHGGTVSIVSSNVRSQAVGGALARASDTFLVSGCALAGSSSPPCVTVKWIVPSARSRAAGDSALTTDSVGLCMSAANAPLGSVVVAVAQPRVSGQ